MQAPPKGRAHAIAPDLLQETWPCPAESAVQTARQERESDDHQKPVRSLYPCRNAMLLSRQRGGLDTGGRPPKPEPGVGTTDTGATFLNCFSAEGLLPRLSLLTSDVRHKPALTLPALGRAPCGLGVVDVDVQLPIFSQLHAARPDRYYKCPGRAAQ